MPKAKPLLAVLAIALLALVPSAGAEEIVPPGNSAASQYTEAFPTTGGERETGGKQGKAVPADVLGARNSHRLESKGKDGKAVAEVAAETAPAPASSAAGQSPEPSSERGGEKTQAGGGSGGGGGATGGGGSGGGPRGGGGSGGSPATGGGHGNAPSAQPDGSSGFGEVVGQMTGSSSSGKLGLWLPLIVIGVVIGSLLYLWRQRQRVA